LGKGERGEEIIDVWPTKGNHSRKNRPQIELVKNEKSKGVDKKGGN